MAVSTLVLNPDGSMDLAHLPEVSKLMGTSVELTADTTKFQAMYALVVKQGSGYAYGDIVTTTSGVRLRIDAIPVTDMSLVVVNQDYIYDSNPETGEVATTGGSGTGLTVSITSVYAPGDTAVIGSLYHTAATDPIVQRSTVRSMVSEAKSQTVNIKQGVGYVGTKQDIVSVANIPEGATALATDTKQIGTYSGGSWTWVSTTLTPNDMYPYNNSVNGSTVNTSGGNALVQEDGTVFLQTSASAPDGTTIVYNDGKLAVGQITDSNISNNANIAITKISGLATELNTKADIYNTVDNGTSAAVDCEYNYNKTETHITDDGDRWETTLDTQVKQQGEIEDLKQQVSVLNNTTPSTTYDFGTPTKVIGSGGIITVLSSGSWTATGDGAIQCQVGGILSVALSVKVNDSMVWTSPVQIAGASLIGDANPSELKPVKSGDVITAPTLLAIGQTLDVTFYPEITITNGTGVTEIATVTQGTICERNNNGIQTLYGRINITDGSGQIIIDPTMAFIDTNYCVSLTCGNVSGGTACTVGITGSRTATGFGITAQDNSGLLNAWEGYSGDVDFIIIGKWK
jgi:hypothetical protein